METEEIVQAERGEDGENAAVQSAGESARWRMRSYEGTWLDDDEIREWECCGSESLGAGFKEKGGGLEVQRRPRWWWCWLSWAFCGRCCCGGSYVCGDEGWGCRCEGFYVGGFIPVFRFVRVGDADGGGGDS